MSSETYPKKFVLMARGNSHIRYFKGFARHTSMQVAVSDVNKAFIRPGDFSHIGLLRKLNIREYLNAHLIKKRKKFPILSRTLVWKVYELTLRLYARVEVMKFCGIIARSHADIVGVWNGQKLPSSGIVFAAKALGKEVVYFENGLLPNTTTCDWHGVNCENAMPAEPEFYRQFASPAPLPQTLMPRVPVKAKAQGAGDRLLPEKYVFVPFQVETDSQIISNSPWIKSMEQLWQHLSNVVSAFKDDAMHIVIKEHPSEVRSYQHLYHGHPRVIFANQVSTQELIENAQAVLTVNSTVGIESLLLKKSVMVMGRACYRIPGICVSISDEREMADTFRQIDSLPIDNTLRDGFLKFMYEMYCIPTTWSQADTVHYQALEKRLMQTDEFSGFSEVHRK